MDMDDTVAIRVLSEYYQYGTNGLSKDLEKSFELCCRAAKLGDPDAYNIAVESYEAGIGVPKNMAKAREYSEKAAKKGNIHARHYLGKLEYDNGNHCGASRHWLISAAAGSTDSLERIGDAYKFKVITKKEYAEALCRGFCFIHKCL